MKRENKGSSFFLRSMVISALMVFVCVGSKAFGEGPNRSIFMSPEYTGIVISEDEDIDMDLILRNNGKQREKVNLRILSVPKGWDARIKTFKHGVTGAFVESGERVANLSLQAIAEEGVGPGTYVFEMEAQTEDQKLTSKCRLVVKVEGKIEDQKFEGVSVNASYPILRGPTGTKFEFNLVIQNRVGKDAIFNLTAKGPENWDVNFKPAYEDKFISSFIIEMGQQKSVSVVVDPSPWAEPGEYTIPIKVSSDEAEAETTLTVTLTGTHKLDMGTADGLLSLDAYKGKESNISIYVKNSGSAPLKDIALLSVKPENWKITFSPESIDTIAAGELKQIEVAITPADQALVGDYSVGLSTKAGKLTEAVELRITVKASTAWGWIGIGIIVLVIAGLVFLFIRLGRR